MNKIQFSPEALILSWCLQYSVIPNTVFEATTQNQRLQTELDFIQWSLSVNLLNLVNSGIWEQHLVLILAVHTTIVQINSNNIYGYNALMHVDSSNACNEYNIQDKTCASEFFYDRSSMSSYQLPLVEQLIMYSIHSVCV